MINELSMLFHDRGKSSQDECCVVELGRCEGTFFRADDDLDNLSINEHGLFRYEHRGQEGRVH